MILEEIEADFNPRSPMRGATNANLTKEIQSVFQSTLPYAGSDGVKEKNLRWGDRISIHAPLCGERHQNMPIFLISIQYVAYFVKIQ